MPIYKKFGLIKIDEARIDETCSAYFKWKDLNTYIKSNSNRGINMPDAISEPMGCYCLDLVWNRGKEVGDATNPRTNEKVEMKATSRFEGDLSSFGPDCSFDDLVFLRFNLEQNLLYVYDLHINSEQFGKYPANSTETIQDQKNQGRRPHVSLQTLFVDAKKLKPDIIFDINDKYYYTKGKYKGQIYEKLVDAMDDQNAVYQWRRTYVRKNKSGVVPTLTANQGEGGHNVCLIKTKYGIRKMTPHECFNTQGFPKDFKLPKTQSDARLYKQAGNSVCVSVIKRIAQSIVEACKNE